MAQSGIHAFSGILLSKSLKYKKWLIPSLIFGTILPDIDILFAALGFLYGFNLSEAESIFHRTFTHNLFFPIVTYFVFLSIAELTSNKKFKIVGKGLCIGIFLHIIIDIFLWFKGVHLFWPLPIAPIKLWDYDNKILVQTLLALEFIFFRIYGWFLINKFIKNPTKTDSIWFIKYVSKWIKLEFFIFILFLLFIYLDISYYKIFFTIAYIPSLIMALISTYILRDVFNH